MKEIELSKLDMTFSKFFKKKREKQIKRIYLFDLMRKILYYYNVLNVNCEKPLLFS